MSANSARKQSLQKSRDESRVKKTFFLEKNYIAQLERGKPVCSRTLPSASTHSELLGIAITEIKEDNSEGFFSALEALCVRAQHDPEGVSEALDRKWPVNLLLTAQGSLEQKVTAALVDHLPQDALFSLIEHVNHIEIALNALNYNLVLAALLLIGTLAKASTKLIEPILKQTTVVHRINVVILEGRHDWKMTEVALFTMSMILEHHDAFPSQELEKMLPEVFQCLASHPYAVLNNLYLMIGRDVPYAEYLEPKVLMEYYLLHPKKDVKLAAAKLVIYVIQKLDSRDLQKLAEKSCKWLKDEDLKDAATELLRGVILSKGEEQRRWVAEFVKTTVEYGESGWSGYDFVDLYELMELGLGELGEEREELERIVEISLKRVKREKERKAGVWLLERLREGRGGIGGRLRGRGGAE